MEESSKKPNYLAIKFLYQGGQTEIVAVDVAQVCYCIKFMYVTMYTENNCHTSLLYLVLVIDLIKLCGWFY